MFFAWIYISAINVNAQEYFHDDFDVAKNCKQLDLITKLKQEPGRCSQRSKGKICTFINSFLFMDFINDESHISGSDEENWVACKKDLYENLVSKCGSRGIKNVYSIIFNIKSINPKF